MPVSRCTHKMGNKQAVHFSSCVPLFCIFQWEVSGHSWSTLFNNTCCPLSCLQVDDTLPLSCGGIDQVWWHRDAGQHETWGIPSTPCWDLLQVRGWPVLHCVDRSPGNPWVPCLHAGTYKGFPHIRRPPPEIPGQVSMSREPRFSPLTEAPQDSPGRPCLQVIPGLEGPDHAWEFLGGTELGPSSPQTTCLGSWRVQAALGCQHCSHQSTQTPAAIKQHYFTLPTMWCNKG